MESLLNTDVLIELDNCYNCIYGAVIWGKSNDPIALVLQKKVYRR